MSAPDGDGAEAAASAGEELQDVASASDDDGDQEQLDERREEEDEQQEEQEEGDAGSPRKGDSPRVRRLNARARAVVSAGRHAVPHTVCVC
jgi:hypothetical protein